MAKKDSKKKNVNTEHNDISADDLETTESSESSEQDSKDSNEAIKKAANEYQSVANENVASESSESVESLKAKIKELEDRYLRTHADFENVKKRLERDKNLALEYANEKILKDILPVADTLENALKAAKEFANENDKGAKIAEGIKLTLDKLHKTLSNHGVEIIESKGEPDPNLHHAISQVPHDSKNEGEIADVLQTGYKYKDRTLRPALVSVVKNG
ncbi:nucleotide exchange factor GrpE [Helicobacter saguini]|uniref:Protein GrpE n=1 Tax=Helicobacter saguini TaxID=1548018 RepID=A0A347W6L0_9HELI|nr:nucleotide exchange factor GrpE [Helicobacter saguini]MWV60975.1 nucleotide exchange factor GrpE [Helicobacter saguini]MWV68356.1 nucleotide exchange factor GrpE [Helicobacter saguini]MWV70179.1 nucleotide exchange factor GrpE [Helicobacter saguini]MWV72082.1 nucleotide exchange factor GrpE [Helicobacter saguini]TLD93698.1 nucleotide exchange factor GrpE [Helicobacter saguini]